MKKPKPDVLTVILFILITSLILIWNIVAFATQDMESIYSSVNVRVGCHVRIDGPIFEKHDRVYLILNANTPVSRISVEPKESLIQLPLDIEGLPYEITYPTMLSRGFFFIANSSGSASIVLDMQPKIPYAVKVCEGNIESTVFSHAEKYIGVRLKAINFTEAGYCQLLLIHPYNGEIQPDFNVDGEIKVLSGKVAYVNLVLMAEDSWYAFNLASFAAPNSTIKFTVNAGSRELFGRDVLGLRVLFLAFGIGLYKGDYDPMVVEKPEAVVAFGKLRIMNNGRETVVEPTVLNEYNLEYRLFVFRKFKPTMLNIALVVALAFECYTLLHLAVKVRGKNWKQ